MDNLIKQTTSMKIIDIRLLSDKSCNVMKDDIQW